MVFRSPGSRPVLPLALIGVLAFAAACSSDNFSGVGGSMPTDVSQDPDSLEVELPPIFPTVTVVITPLDTIPAEERPALYIGERPAGAWRGTPLIQFDVGDSLIQEMVPLDWSEVVSVQIRITGMVQVDDAAVVRDVRALELLDPLTTDDIFVEDVTTLFGAELGTATWNIGAEGIIDVPLDVAEAWFTTGMHNGVALEHVAPDAPPELYSNFAGYGGADFGRSSRLYAGTFSGPPVLFVQLSDALENFRVPVLLNLGHIERDLPGPQDLQIGSYIERRLWIDFDLNPEIVPTDATINAGTLVLQVREDLTMQVRPFSSFGPQALIIDQLVRAYEATRAEAGDDPAIESAYGRSSRQVLNGSADFNPDPGGGDVEITSEFRIDVTEYIQRQVNEVIPDDVPGGTTIPDVGLLLAFVTEDLDLDLGVFYGLDATDDLKPRLEITYTPPADSWR